MTNLTVDSMSSDNTKLHTSNDVTRTSPNWKPQHCSVAKLILKVQTLLIPYTDRVSQLKTISRKDYFQLGLF